MRHTRTKIMGTIGPASNSPEVLRALIRNGLDIVRLNFSHIDEEDYDFTVRLIQFIRETAARYDRNVAIFQDLGGIKLRIGTFDVADETVYLTPGDRVRLSPIEISSDPSVIPFPHEDILQDFRQGDRVYLADGTIRLDVVGKNGLEVEVRVQHGGALSSHKGINLPGMAISRPIMTEKDKRDARFGVEQGADWVGVSFVRTAQDIKDVKAYLGIIGSRALVMAKIEKQLALKNIDAIIAEADGIMVARGDLGIEIPMEEVPRQQVRLVRKAQAAGKPCIIATQMIASMVYAPRPTRAECSDVFNSVWCGCGILLSDEMAVGRYPLDVLKVAIKTIRKAEAIYAYYPSLHAKGQTEVTVRSACLQAQAYKKAKVVVLTTSGRTAIAMAKFQPKVPIIAVSHTKETLQKLAMVWGVQTGGVIPPAQDMEELVSLAIDKLIETRAVDPVKDIHVIMTFGYIPGVTGTTNTTMHLDLPEYLAQRERRSQVREEEAVVA